MDLFQIHHISEYTGKMDLKNHAEIADSAPSRYNNTEKNPTLYKI